MYTAGGGGSQGYSGGSGSGATGSGGGASSITFAVTFEQI